MKFHEISSIWTLTHSKVKYFTSMEVKFHRMKFHYFMKIRWKFHFHNLRRFVKKRESDPNSIIKRVPLFHLQTNSALLLRCRIWLHLMQMHCGDVIHFIVSLIHRVVGFFFLFVFLASHVFYLLVGSMSEWWSDHLIYIHS